jgi:RNA polymerase sigma-54 factor
VKLSQNLSLHPEQKPLLTRELVQAIHLLQFPAGKLMAFIEEWTRDNPFVEVETVIEEPADSTRLQRNLRHSSHSEPFLRTAFPSMEEYLRGQILHLSLKPEEEAVFTYYIRNLDEHGFLKADVEPACRLLGVSRETGEAMLHLLQSLDPPGIGARSLKEAIILQLKRKGKLGTGPETLLQNHFEAFLHRRWNLLPKNESISEKELQALWNLVKTCDPKPGGFFSADMPVYIIPDITASRQEGNWQIRLTEEGMYRIKWNGSLSDGLLERDPGLADYIRRQYDRFRWLERSLRSRRKTLRALASVILEKQGDFFLHKRSHLVPLSLREAARLIGVHESTASRAVKDKYIQVAGKTYPLRKLFSHALDRGGSTSADEILKEIRDLVEEEDKRNPRSDQDLANILIEKGYRISRRTVAKYRQKLRIPPSRERKLYR